MHSGFWSNGYIEESVKLHLPGMRRSTAVLYSLTACMIACDFSENTKFRLERAMRVDFGKRHVDH